MEAYDERIRLLKEQAVFREIGDRLDPMLQGGRESMKIWFFAEI
jgi:hypothetical protein